MKPLQKRLKHAAIEPPSVARPVGFEKTEQEPEPAHYHSSAHTTNTTSSTSSHPEPTSPPPKIPSPPLQTASPSPSPQHQSPQSTCFQKSPQLISSQTPDVSTHFTEFSKGYIEINLRNQLASRMSILLASFKQKTHSFLLKTFSVLENLVRYLPRQYASTFFTLTTHFYHVADLIELESWDKYVNEEMELENQYGISSIWMTIRTFESIIQDLID